MKKIINNKKYDTETAKRIGRFEQLNNGYYEELYVKTTGEFFLYLPSENSTVLWDHRDELDEYRGMTLVSVICPLSEDAAKEWVSKVMDGEVYEELFGEVAE